MCEQVGDVATSDTLRERVLAEETGLQNPTRGALYLDHARRLVQRGEHALAIDYFERAHALASSDRAR